MEIRLEEEELFLGGIRFAPRYASNAKEGGKGVKKKKTDCREIKIKIN